MSWLDSLSLTSAPLNHRLRYRALCDMRARAHVLVLSCPEPDEAWRHAVQMLDVMVSDADSYLRLR